MTEAIDSNDPELFCKYVYQDQSDGRKHVALLPKIEDLIYALSINVDEEVANFKIRDAEYSREKYIENLCSIINSILILNEQLMQRLSRENEKDNQNMIHIAVFNSCPEVLEYLLKRISANCSKANMLNMINKRNRRKNPRTPLELALMLGSEEKVEILIFYGADIKIINFDNLGLDIKNISSEKVLIECIICNQDMLKYLKGLSILGLRANQVCNLIEFEIAEYKRAEEEKLRKEQARLERERQARLAEQKRMRVEQQARLERQRVEQARLEREIQARLAEQERIRVEQQARLEHQRIEQARLEREREERLAERESQRAIEQFERKRAKAKFKLDRTSKRRILSLAGLGVAALVLYKLFTSEEIPSNEILNLID